MEDSRSSSLIKKDIATGYTLLKTISDKEEKKILKKGIKHLESILSWRDYDRKSYLRSRKIMCAQMKYELKQMRKERTEPIKKKYVTPSYKPSRVYIPQKVAREVTWYCYDEDSNVTEEKTIEYYYK